VLRLRTVGDRLPAGALDQVRARLAADGLIAYPTETLYGLGCDPRRPVAVARLLRAKGRSDGKPLPLIAASAGEARRLLRLDEGETDLFEALARTFWPGPLTLIAAAAASADRPAAGVAAADDSLALRVSSNPIAVGVAAAGGGAIVSTSANPAGAPPPDRPEAIDAGLLALVDLLVDGGPTTGGLPSTVVDLRGGTVQLRRPGAIAWDQVLEALSARR